MVAQELRSCSMYEGRDMRRQVPVYCFPIYLFFFLLRAAGSSSSLYSRGILEKGEKPHVQSAEPYKHRQLSRTAPQTQQGTKLLKDGKSTVPLLLNSALSAGRGRESTDFHRTKSKSAACTKHLNSHARAALIFSAVLTHPLLHLTHTWTPAQSKAKVCSSDPACTLIS